MKTNTPPLINMGFARRVKLVLLAMLGGVSMLQGHNLDTTSTYVNFAQDFINTMANRLSVGQNLIQVGDEFWVLMKTTPGPGTPSGVGGYTTFYLPEGYQVLDAAYVKLSAFDPRGFTPVPMKGQSPIAIGAGAIGAKAAVGLTGFHYPSANILGVNEDPVTAAGVSRGTICHHINTAIPRGHPSRILPPAMPQPQRLQPFPSVVKLQARMLMVTSSCSAPQARL